MNFNRIGAYQDKHVGKNALLLCNGPSLRRTDPSWVKESDLVTFGLNKIHLATELGFPIPDYTVAVNKKVINQLKSDESFKYKKLVLSHRAGMVFPEGEDVFYINTEPYNLPRFSLDCCIGVHEGWTVTHAALQLIYYFGIRNVIIVGMDHNFDSDPALANKAETRVGDDHNHFSPSYFAAGQEWDLPDLRNSEISYAEARRSYERSGGLIIDATIGGKCNVFLRAEFRDALRLVQR
jgi:hypothetical protein